MAPVAFPHGEHPDGDPFAAIDQQRHANSALGRLEAKAVAEQAALEKQQQGGAAPQQQQGTPQQQQSPATNRATVPPPTRSASLRSSRNTPSLYSSANKKGPAEVVVLEDSEDDVQEAKEAAAQVTGKRGASASASKPASKGKATRKHARTEPQEDTVMADVEQPEAQRARTKSPSPAPAIDPPPLPAVPALTRADSSNSLSSLPSSRATSPVPEKASSAAPSPAKVPDTNAEETKMSTVGAEVDKVLANAASRSPLEVPVNVPAGNHPAPARARAKSPPAPLPKPKHVPRTIRLEIKLPAPGTATEVPQFNLDELAREAGYTEEPEDEEDKEGDESEGEEGDSEESDGDGGKKKKDKGKEKEDDKMEGVEATNGAPEEPVKKRRKRGPNVVQGRHGGYDVDDPFVDDTEIELYEPKHYVPAARPGFFVCTGEVEVETKRHRGRQAGSKNKPKFDANGNPIAATRKKSVADPATPGASSGNASGTPMEQQPSVSSLPAFGSTGPLPPPPKPKKPERSGPHTFSAELQGEIDALKAEIKPDDFAVKGKFPPRLRPLLVSVAHKAIELDEYDDDFFAILPKMFPYNLFTMKKLVKREVFPKRILDLTAQQEGHIDVIRRGVNDTLAKQKADFDELHKKWEVEKAVWDAGLGSRQASRAGTPDPMGPPPLGAAPLAAVSGVGTPGSSKPNQDGTSPAPGGKEEDGPAEPKWKFRFTEAMRMAVLHAVELDDEMTQLIIEKQELEKAVEKGEKAHSAINARKNLYAKINALWPSGDMTTNQLSREMSAAKSKLKKKNEANDA